MPSMTVLVPIFSAIGFLITLTLTLRAEQPGGGVLIAILWPIVAIFAVFGALLTLVGLE